MGKYGIVIGVNYVKNPEAALEGCCNDARLMVNLLKSKGFEDENIKLLIDDDDNYDSPDHVNVKNALSWLCKGRSAGDIIFMHFSGHGTQVPADDDDVETDNLDEAICLEELFLMADDDLKQFFAELPEGAKATVVMDCCHSGSMLDGTEVVIKGAKDADSAAPQEESASLLSVLGGSRDVAANRSLPISTICNVMSAKLGQPVSPTGSGVNGAMAQMFGGNAGKLMMKFALGQIAKQDGGSSNPLVGMLGGVLGGSKTSTSSNPLGALMGGGSAQTTSSNPLGSLMGGGQSNGSSNPLGSLMGGGQSTGSSNPLGSLMGGGGSTESSNPLGSLMGGGGSTESSNPLGSLMGGGGSTESSNPLGSLMGGGGQSTESSNPLGSLMGGGGQSTESSNPLGSLMGGGGQSTGSSNPLGSLMGGGGSTESSNPLGSLMGGGGGTGSSNPLGSLMGGGGTTTTTSSSSSQNPVSMLTGMLGSLGLQGKKSSSSAPPYNPQHQGLGKDVCTLITGCQANETSADVRPPGGDAFGALTKTLTSCYEQNPETSFYDLVVNVRGELSKGGFKQNPCLECSEAASREIFIC